MDPTAVSDLLQRRDVATTKALQDTQMWQDYVESTRRQRGRKRSQAALSGCRNPTDAGNDAHASLPQKTESRPPAARTTYAVDGVEYGQQPLPRECSTATEAFSCSGDYFRRARESDSWGLDDPRQRLEVAQPNGDPASLDGAHRYKHIDAARGHAAPPSVLRDGGEMSRRRGPAAAAAAIEEATGACWRTSAPAESGRPVAGLAAGMLMEQMLRFSYASGERLHARCEDSFSSLQRRNRDAQLQPKRPYLADSVGSPSELADVSARPRRFSSPTACVTEGAEYDVGAGHVEGAFSRRRRLRPLLPSSVNASHSPLRGPPASRPLSPPLSPTFRIGAPSSSGLLTISLANSVAGGDDAVLPWLRRSRESDEEACVAGATARREAALKELVECDVARKEDMQRLLARAAALPGVGHFSFEASGSNCGAGEPFSAEDAGEQNGLLFSDAVLL